MTNAKRRGGPWRPPGWAGHAVRWIAVAALCLAAVSPSWATVESTLLANQPVAGTPLDVVLSADGKYVFILVPGEILVYSGGGQTLEGKVAVDPKTTTIAVAPRGDFIFAGTGESKTLAIIGLDFVYNIDVTGSPFKGPENAPVTVTVFEDYQ